MADRQQPNTLSKTHLDRMHREQRQTRYIIIGTVVAIAAVLLLILYGYLDSTVLRYRKPVATVNGVNINGEEFRGFTKYYRYSIIKQTESTLQIAQMFGSDQSMLQQFTSQLQNYSNAMIATNAGQAALDQMIDAELIKQEAQKRGITVSAEEIETRFREMMDYYPNGTPTATSTSAPVATSTLNPTQVSMLQPSATPTITPTLSMTESVNATATAAAAPTATLAPTELPTPTGPITPTATPTTAPTATPYTLEGYQGAVATLKADLNTTYEIPETTLKWIVETGLYREKLSQAIVGDLPCSQEQVWAQHILVADASLAEVVLQKYKNGEDWYSLAAQYSSDSTKDKGGDLGWFGKGAMVKEFEDAAFALEPGQVSEPVQSQFGWHIIRLMGKEDRPLNGSECQTYKDNQFQSFVNDLKAAAKIVKNEEYWQSIVPLNPTFPADIQQILDNLNASQQQQQQPVQPQPVP